MGTTAFSTQMDRTAAVHTDLIFTGLRHGYFSESPVREHLLLFLLEFLKSHSEESETALVGKVMET